MAVNGIPRMLPAAVLAAHWQSVSIPIASPSAASQRPAHKTKELRPLHVYTIEVTGQGNPVNLNLQDCFYGDNSGLLTVEIIAPPQTLIGKILSPTDGYTIGRSTISLNAEASSRIGTDISEVQFYVFYDGTWHPAGIDTTYPYGVSWQTPNNLKSQILRVGINVVDTANNIVRFAGGTHRVNYIESIGNTDVVENWIPTRVYLNQRFLEPNGDSKCNVASMTMLLAMNGIIGSDIAIMRDKANEMYPYILNANGDATVGNMVNELNRQQMTAETRSYAVQDAWSKIKEEVDVGRPVIIRTAHGVVTEFGHFFVAVGYREAEGIREVIAYDPFGRWKGTCCNNNYNFNSREPASRKGQWVTYDFDYAFGRTNWLITARRANSLHNNAGNSPSTMPDLITDEPESLGSYRGIDIFVINKIFLPLLKR